MTTKKETSNIERIVRVASDKAFRTISRNLAKEAYSRFKTTREITFSIIRRDESVLVARIVALDDTIIDNYETYEYYARSENAKVFEKYERSNFYSLALNRATKIRIEEKRDEA